MINGAHLLAFIVGGFVGAAVMWAAVMAERADHHDRLRWPYTVDDALDRMSTPDGAHVAPERVASE